MARRDGIDTVTSDRTGKVSHRARVSWIDADGERHHRSKSCRTKREAERWRRDTLATVDRGDYFEPQPVTVAELAGPFLATIERGKAGSTYRQYRGMYDNHVAPRFGERRIGAITATQIQSWYDELGRTYSASTVGAIHKVMRGIFGHAVTDGLIRTNPTDGRRMPKDAPTEVEAWTPEQARTFLAHVEHDDDALPMVLMLATGLRISEALALRWTDVDLDARTARVHRTVQVVRGGSVIVDRPKTDTSNRTVVLPAVAIMALRRQHALSGGGELVFPGRLPRSLAASTVRDRLERYIAATGLPRITPHGLRRTAVTLLVHQGVHPKIAAVQFGHSVEMMLRLYARVDIEMQSRAASALDEALGMPLGTGHAEVQASEVRRNAD